MSISMKNWPKNERPMERLAAHGADALSTSELLAIIIGTGNPRRQLSPLDLARALIQRAGNLQGLERMALSEMQRLSGLGFVKCCRLRAGLALARRLNENGNDPRPKLSGAREIAAFLSPRMSRLATEQFRVLMFNPRLELIGQHQISMGGTCSVPVHPREVFHEAVRMQASGVVAVHNHPSGDPQPSSADQQLTARLAKAGEVVGIPLLDHIIIGERGRYFAFSELSNR